MNNNQRIFVIVAIVFGVIIIALFLFRPLKNFYYHHRYHKIYGFSLKVIARENNYILLNNLVLSLGEGNFIHIDHLLFADKFIYVIKDRNFVGSLEALEDNRYWFFYSLKGKQKAVSNSLDINQERIDKLSLITGIDASMFVNVVLLNDSCNLAPSPITRPNTYIIKLRRIKASIKKVESRDVPPLNRIQLEKIANDILKLNKKD